MGMKVEVISRETIKPSSLTPFNLKNLTISFLDQTTPPVPVPILLFYHASDIGKNVLEQSNDLKKSLSETLTYFYPLAGTIGKDNKIVDCDDYGVEYLETRVDVRLSEVLSKHPDEGYIMNQFIPTNLHYITELGTCRDNLVQLVIQVNMFDCGGMVIGVSMLHKIADAASLGTFINAWARRTSVRLGNIEGIHKEKEPTIIPSIDAAFHFPPNEVPSVLSFKMNSEDSEIATVCKRFVFDSSKIVTLKAKSANNSHVANPTKVESVTALLWKCASKLKGKADKVLESSSQNSKPFMLCMAVNLRQRMIPALPDHSFGNFIAPALVGLSNQPGDIELHKLVETLRSSIRKINGDYIKDEFQVNYGLVRSLQDVHERFNKEEMELHTITSWCRFPFYESDFGWGKPTWICTVNVIAKNVCILMDTSDGCGIEAWVTLDEQQMSLLESDYELREFLVTQTPAVTAGPVVQF
ncbi:vinorine synthase-like [Papaver somniferum]|uniref:vinorine synthase-like n=1 Tax=Papaver somniferum TaxID=3469 RepID=UPI000E70001B|nr:vinorine synthase-like [Papaver somniferum]